MEWYNLFRTHILERGREYYQNGYISSFDMYENNIEAEVSGTEDYHVEIEFEGDNLIYMNCDCPHAESGNNCKHMAAVLFRFEEELCDDGIDREDAAVGEKTELTLEDRYANRRKDAVDLVNKIPEDKVREMLVQYVLSDNSLRNRLNLEYSTKLDAGQMLALKNEINDIVDNNSHRGYVDWYHASDFTGDLSNFLESKVKVLIEKNYLEQAFELTNLVFHCIGNIDMDDSDGGSTYVADDCYECWKLILQKCDNQQKEKIRKWFEAHQNGYVIDYMEEYLQEFLYTEFLLEENIKERIAELDEIISMSSGSNDCSSIYSVHYGYENAIIKRIDYMEMLGCTEAEILEYRRNNRQFFVIREMEINEALNIQDYEKAKQILLESKRLDADYPKQVKKYSRQLIDLYKRNGEIEEYRKELLYQLQNCSQEDLKYFLALKEIMSSWKEWESTVDLIINSNRDLYFVCKILNEQKRYEELMDKIKKDDNIYLLDEYENNLKKAVPDSVIEIYTKFVLKEVQRVSDRNGYRHLMVYLKKISKISNGKEVASEIAEQWKSEYRRRSAMMDELRKAGF